ncbi:hypothetical protein AGMMS49545_10460 [Betaproteobacteria bacterium]|nr:hypothetical protein AGMMS49545_10460 [Betaproteobacteria bacterium]GHU44380.1 hypothetical protein AGMMS50289_12540 [Betaproteobacteria bacterium]
MTALTQDTNIIRRDGVDFVFPVAAGAWIHAGAVVALNADGYAVPGTTATDLQGAGIAQAAADNRTGAAGSVTIAVRRGCYQLANSAAADTIRRCDIGKPCYIVDDNTVALTATGKSQAGVIRDVDGNGVWVEF